MTTQITVTIVNYKQLLNSII